MGSKANKNLALAIGGRKSGRLLKMLLEVGFLLFVRNTLAEAIEVLRRVPFRLVIIDNERVQIDVLTLILAIREIDKEIPVVFVGPKSAQQNPDEALSQANTFWVEFPAGSSELAEQIKTLLVDSTAQGGSIH
ncbi:MAG TPA: hypothetical protein VM492_10260 [Sumerlaeia bacterium]|nr:hypothetical protein [Sumerlaeia bacterium]